MLTAAMSRSTAADTGVAPAKARLPPSAFKVRRSSSGSPASHSTPCSASNAWTAMPGRHFQLGGHRGGFLAVADQSGIGARAQRQPERVEQDRFAGAGLAGQHAEAGLELELEPVDQHDVLDGELP